MIMEQELTLENSIKVKVSIMAIFFFIVLNIAFTAWAVPPLIDLIFRTPIQSHNYQSRTHIEPVASRIEYSYVG